MAVKFFEMVIEYLPNLGQDTDIQISEEILNTTLRSRNILLT